MNRGAWWAAVHGVAKKSDTTEQLNHNLVKYTNTGGPRKHHNEKNKHENCRQVYGLALYV